MSLTREEVEQRLEEKVEGTKRLVATGRERDALQTALAVMDERDEILTAKKRDSQMAIRYYSKYQEAIVERDALAAEGRLLREAVEHLARSVGENYPPEIDLAYETAVSVLTKATPLIAAEVARVKQLEAVAEAAIDVIDGCPYKGVLDFPELRAALDDWRNNDSI